VVLNRNRKAVSVVSSPAVVLNLKAVVSNPLKAVFDSNGQPVPEGYSVVLNRNRKAVSVVSSPAVVLNLKAVVSNPLKAVFDSNGQPVPEGYSVVLNSNRKVVPSYSVVIPKKESYTLNNQTNRLIRRLLRAPVKALGMDF
jgi:pyruvate-formate lyase-activating enzyme